MPTLKCPACSARVFAGTLYCYNCTENQTVVGKYGVLDGQLVWTASGQRAPAAAWAVLDREQQVSVSAVHLRQSVPVTLQLEVARAGRSAQDQPPLYARVNELLRAVLEGEEFVEAEAEG